MKSKVEGGIRLWANPILISPVLYAKAAQLRREQLEAIASLIEHGQPLQTQQDRDVAAMTLRDAAKLIPEEKPKGRGNPHKIDTTAVFCKYLGFLEGSEGSEQEEARAPMTKTAATAELAKMCDVSIESIRKAIKKEKAVVARLVKFMRDETSPT